MQVRALKKGGGGGGRRGEEGEKEGGGADGHDKLREGTPHPSQLF